MVQLHLAGTAEPHLYGFPKVIRLECGFSLVPLALSLSSGPLKHDFQGLESGDLIWAESTVPHPPSQLLESRVYLLVLKEWEC